RRTDSKRPRASPMSGPWPRSAARQALAENRESALRRSYSWWERSLRWRFCGRPALGRQYGRSAESTQDGCYRASGPLGSDEFVDAVAQVLKYKILVCSGFAVVDLLGPLLERKFDPKGLVDGECDIKKIETVDPEIINRMTFRLYGVARNITGFSDNIGDGVE